MLVVLSTPCLALGGGGRGGEDSGLPSLTNVCRQMVRAHFCPSGTCPTGTQQRRYAEQSRCMRHYGNVRIKG
jgi:hypothetical protein